MFCVVWNKIEKSLIKTDILEKMRRGSRYFVERKNCQSLWLLTLENSTTDFCFSDRFSVYFKGCVYNKEELQKLLPNSKDCSIAHIINQLYQIYGTFLFEKINGLFVVIIIDTLKRNVLIARDRFGWKSIYYHKAQNWNEIWDFIPTEIALSTTERMLLIEINKYPLIVKKSEEQENPAILLDWLGGLCRLYNSYYASQRVILEDWSVNEVAYALAKAFKQVAKNATVLCNIATPERI